MSAYGLVGASIASVLAQALLGGCSKLESRSDKASSAPASAYRTSPASEPAPHATAEMPARGDEGAFDAAPRGGNVAPMAKIPGKAGGEVDHPWDGDGKRDAKKKEKEAPPAAPQANVAPKGPAGLAGVGVTGGSGKGFGGQGVLAPADPAKAVADDQRAKQVAQAGIDPNGRFATTYRPGAGHLAA